MESVIEKANKVQEETLEYFKKQEENREINEKMRNLAFNYRLTKEFQPSKEEELQREVAQLKIEVKNLRIIVDELGYIIMNNPLIRHEKYTETAIIKSQNTLKILNRLCQV